MRRPSCVITAWRERLSFSGLTSPGLPRSLDDVGGGNGPAPAPCRSAVCPARLSDRLSTPYCTGVSFCVLHSRRTAWGSGSGAASISGLRPQHLLGRIEHRTVRQGGRCASFRCFVLSGSGMGRKAFTPNLVSTLNSTPPRDSGRAPLFCARQRREQHQHRQQFAETPDQHRERIPRSGNHSVPRSCPSAPAAPAPPGIADHGHDGRKAVIRSSPTAATGCLARPPTGRTPV